MDIKFDEVELQKINLAPGDVLTVKLKLKEDSIPHESISMLKQQLEELFPRNGVIVLTLPFGYDLTMEAITQPEEAESDNVQSYCSDCSCGKKESAENSGRW